MNGPFCCADAANDPEDAPEPFKPLLEPWKAPPPGADIIRAEERVCFARRMKKKGGCAAENTEEVFSPLPPPGPPRVPGKQSAKIALNKFRVRKLVTPVCVSLVYLGIP